jgi:peptidyl-prolyl cis-trans isomerase B (cyclophilin B)
VLSFLLNTCSKAPFNANVRSILNYQNSGQIEMLLEKSEDRFRLPEERYRVCLATANSRDTTIVVRLSRYLKDQSPLVRQGAAFALGQLPCSSAAALLIRRLALENDQEVLRQIILSLGKTGDLSAARYLHNTFFATEFTVPLLKASCYFFTREIILDELIEDCVLSLRSENEKIRRAAAVALQRVGSPEKLNPHIGSLTTCTGNPDIFIRQSIARILRKVDFNDKSDFYRGLIGDPAWQVRYEACQALSAVEKSEKVWLICLKDANSHVVSAAIRNTPPDVRFSESVIRDLDTLYQNSPLAVRGAIVELIFSRPDTSLAALRDAIPIDGAVLSDKAHGLSQQISRNSYMELLALSFHRQAAVSSAAYGGILSILDSLYSRDIITNIEYNRVLINGLASDDPVQICLAAGHISETGYNDPEILELLYSCLEKHHQYKYRESNAMVLQSIEKLAPADAPERLSALLKSPQCLLRAEVHRILTNVFYQNVPKPIDTSDPFLYSSLSKIRQHGPCPIVRFSTNRGSFSIRCDGYYAPYTVAAFLDCVDSGFYNGLTFHRVIPNFIIQGGDPRGDGWGGPNYHLLTEKSPLEYQAGSVGMANSGPDTEGSQFFITTTPQNHLDYNYTRFGEVVRGMDSVQKIEQGDRIISASIIAQSD